MKPEMPKDLESEKEILYANIGERASKLMEEVSNNNSQKPQENKNEFANLTKKQMESKILSKRNMTNSDKENMIRCISLSHKDVYKRTKNDIEFFTMLNNAVEYGPNYIKIWWIKYSREPLVKDKSWKQKLTTREQYIHELKEQNKEGITYNDLLQSIRSLPHPWMLWLLLWARNEVVENDRNILSGIIGSVDDEISNDEIYISGTRLIKWYEMSMFHYWDRTTDIIDNVIGINW